MKRRLTWLDWLLILTVIGASALIAYERYFKTVWFPAPKPAIKYQIDRSRRDEVERIVTRLAVDTKDWYTLVILPKPRNQGPTHDDFMKSYYDGELSPLVQRAARYIYVEDIKEVPKKFEPRLAQRQHPEDLIFVVCYKDKAVYWTEIHARHESGTGEPWVHCVVDELINTLHRWMNQQ